MTKTIDALVEALEELLYADTEKARSLSHAALAQARAEQAEYFPTRTMVARHSPSSEETAAAFNLGAGRPVVQATDAERRQFEAWMAGHNWLCAQWDGKQYTDVFTRTTWAAWRDRAELARAEQAEPVAVGDERSLFTSWLLTQGWVQKPSARENGTYVNGQVQARWHAWKARADIATPPAAPVAKLEPLSDDAISGMITNHWCWDKVAPRTALEFARAVEAAHNAKLGGAK